MTKRVGRRLTALTLALLLAAVTITTAIPSASAHTAWETKTKYRQECFTYTVMTPVFTHAGWEPFPVADNPGERLIYKPQVQKECRRVPYQARVRRTHWHLTERVCTAVKVTTTAAGAGAGGYYGAKKGKPFKYASAGAIGGEAVGEEVCRWLPKITFYPPW